MKKLVLIFFLLMLASIRAASAETIIVNSEDWRDVYSSMLYGNLQGITNTHFLVSRNHGTLILNQVNPSDEILAFSSRRNPFIVGYRAVVESRGFECEETVYDDFNLELAEELDEITNFIVIDDSYGYNAISVAPYAVVSNSYVLFADRNNIRRIANFLSGRTVDSLIIYGHVNREVLDSLEPYTPEIINKEGDRFYNNIEITKKYQAISPSTQAVLTNGEFIESEIMSGKQPVLFIGTNNVPDQIKDYIQNSEIDIGVLIGNELVGTATTIRRQVGISVFVKFAQGARSPDSAISQVEALDMFYLPTYILNLELDSIKYNRATGMLEVTIRNTEGQAVFFKGTHSLIDSNGITQTVGDIDPIFLEGNSLKTMIYEVQPMADGKINGDIYIIYGESKNSLEKALSGTFEVGVIDVLDECEIEITNLVYDKRKKEFHVELKNIVDTKKQITCYASSEVIDVVVDGFRTTVGSTEVVEIGPGRKAHNIIEVELSDEDIEENEIVTVRTSYGQRNNALVRTKERDFELNVKGVDYITFTLILIIIILIILILIKRKKDKEKKH
ncbi:MAG: hypothetical protein PHV16_01540 [Candidatus Nanoarchaeia archaeon]|nr:hypothetical protein [Candidatus Nanoarchaeia archaeon]